MNKKNNLALPTLFFCGVISLFAFNISAQESELTKSNETKPCSDEKFVMPTMIPSDTMALEYYLKVFSLPNGKRQKEFSALSDADKADVFKIQLAMNLVKRPYLTKEQQNLILETILDVSADTYSIR